MKHSGNAIRRPRILATGQKGAFFNKLLESYHRTHWLTSDPIQYVHRYSNPDDREIVAFIAACFAYGQVVLVHRAISAILAPMGERPSTFVRKYSGESL